MTRSQPEEGKYSIRHFQNAGEGVVLPQTTVASYLSYFALFYLDIKGKDFPRRLELLGTIGNCKDD